MIKEEMENLVLGDIVQNGGRHFIVMGHYGSRVTVAWTAEMTNSVEWDLVSRWAHRRNYPDNPCFEYETENL